MVYMLYAISICDFHVATTLRKHEAASNTMKNDVNATPDFSTQSGRGARDDVTNLTAAEVRRKRERERYSSLSTEQKQARLQNNREYKQRKEEATTSLSVICTSQDENTNSSIVCTPSTIITGRVPLRDITNYPSFGATQNCVGTVSPKVLQPHQPIVTPSGLPFTLDDNVFYSDQSSPTGVATESTTAREIPSLGTITDSKTTDLKRKRINNCYSSLSTEQKDAYLQRNRECRKRKEEAKQTYQTPPESAPTPTPLVLVPSRTLQVSQGTVNHGNCLNQPTPQDNKVLDISGGDEALTEWLGRHRWLLGKMRAGQPIIFMKGELDGAAEPHRDSNF